jgi:hypothetical protein
LVFSGCAAPAGSWKTVRVEPQGAVFPIERLSLDDRGRFTATGVREDDRRTLTGEYRIRRGRLCLTPDGGEEERYDFARRVDGSLRLQSLDPAFPRPVTATLRPAKE